MKLKSDMDNDPSFLIKLETDMDNYRQFSWSLKQAWTMTVIFGEAWSRHGQWSDISHQAWSRHGEWPSVFMKLETDMDNDLHFSWSLNQTWTVIRHLSSSLKQTTDIDHHFSRSWKQTRHFTSRLKTDIWTTTISFQEARNRHVISPQDRKQTMDNGRHCLARLETDTSFHLKIENRHWTATVIVWRGLKQTRDKGGVTVLVIGSGCKKWGGSERRGKSETLLNS